MKPSIRLTRPFTLLIISAEQRWETCSLSGCIIYLHNEYSMPLEDIMGIVCGTPAQKYYEQNNTSVLRSGDICMLNIHNCRETFDICSIIWLYPDIQAVINNCAPLHSHSANKLSNMGVTAIELVDGTGATRGTQIIHDNLHDLSNVSEAARRFLETCYVTKKHGRGFGGGECSDENMEAIREDTQHLDVMIGDGISSEQQWAEFLQGCGAQKPNVLVSFAPPGCN